MSKEKPLESYEQTPQKLCLRITISNFKKRLINRGYPQTLIENLLSDIKFTERGNALLKHSKEKKEVLPFVTQYQPSVSTLKEALMEKWNLIQNQPSPNVQRTTYHFLQESKIPKRHARHSKIIKGLHKV